MSAMPEDLKAKLLRAAAYRIERLAESPEAEAVWPTSRAKQTEKQQ